MLKMSVGRGKKSRNKKCEKNSFGLWLMCLCTCEFFFKILPLVFFAVLPDTLAPLRKQIVNLVGISSICSRKLDCYCKFRIQNALLISLHTVTQRDLFSISLVLRTKNWNISKVLNYRLNQITGSVTVI